MVVILYLLVAAILVTVLLWVFLTYKERKEQTLFGKILFERELMRLKQQKDHFES